MEIHSARHVRVGHGSCFRTGGCLVGVAGFYDHVRPRSPPAPVAFTLCGRADVFYFNLFRSPGVGSSLFLFFKTKFSISGPGVSCVVTGPSGESSDRASSPHFPARQGSSPSLWRHQDRGRCALVHLHLTRNPWTPCERSCLELGATPCLGAGTMTYVGVTPWLFMEIINKSVILSTAMLCV